MKNLYDDYCRKVCGHLKVSQRQCFSGGCNLKNFFDGTLMNIPQDTMNAISTIIHTVKLEDSIKSSRYGSMLKELNLNGNKAELKFSDEDLSQNDKLKLKNVNPDEILILSLYRVVITSPSIRQIKIVSKLINHPEVFIDTNRERAIKLIGPDGISSIKKTWSSIWDYFKPLLKDATFATNVRRFLNELTQENPISQGPTSPTGWMGKVLR
ncbi:MAG: hypothetical protein KAS39_07880 [Actinomycetia bacterium]|nr:hypothetical protein [Actinomycetes bacterium]